MKAIDDTPAPGGRKFDSSHRNMRRKKMSDHIHIIPPDICREIFILLPPVSLIRFRSVSKAWQSIIDDPSFVQAHTHKQQQQQQPSILLRNSSGLYTFDLETLIPTNGSQKIPASTLNLAPSALPPLSHLPVATCNGLMLIPPEHDRSGKQTWEIWNTLTQERLELLPPPAQIKRPNWLCLVGLAYDPSSDDYKAVAIFEQTPFYVLRPHVYSLKSDTWRAKSDFPCFVQNVDHSFGAAGVFLGGALHWISSDLVGHARHMFSFDIGTENLRELEPPPGLRGRDHQEFMNREFRLDVLDGCLAVSDYGHDDDSMKQHFDIWVMKEYGVEDSWTLLYKLPAFDSGYPPRPCLRMLRPVACMKKDKRQLFMQDHERFYLFDVEKNSSKVVDIQGFGGDGGPVTAQVFHGTIFRLHDHCGGVTAAERRRRKRREIKKSNMKIVDTQLLFRLRDFRFVGPARY